MNFKAIPRQYVSHDLIDKFKVLFSIIKGKTLKGKDLKRFEKKLKNYIGAKEIILVPSGRIESIFQDFGFKNGGFEERVTTKSSCRKS